MDNKALFDYGKKLGYRIEPDGTIVGSGGVPIKGYFKKNGYCFFTIRQPAAEGRRVREVKVHRFQAYQKYGDMIFTKGVVIRHKDNNKSNNTWDNIVIGDSYDNAMDNPKEQRVARAVHAASFLRRFSDAQIQEMLRLRYVEKKSYREIAVQMGASSKGHVHWIISRHKKPA